MHEMGIASSVLEAVHQELHRYPKHRAAKIVLRIGEFAGVDPESLQFCFEAVVKGTELEPLELEIQWRGQSDELELAHLELEEAREAAV